MEGYQLVPLEYKFVLDPVLEKELAEHDFEAVLDFGPVGKKIKHFADHHLSNTQKAKDYADRKAIEVDVFDATAPSGVSRVDVLGKKLWGKGVSRGILDPANRGDTAKYLTEQPTSWKEFWDGDVAWQYAVLVRSVKDSPRGFVQLCKDLFEKPLKEVVEMECYKINMDQDLRTNAKIKALSEMIKLDTLTFVITKERTQAKYITRPLMFRMYTGICKVTILINPADDLYKVAFGVDIAVAESDLEQFRVDKLAEYVGRHLKNGGGHKRASGALIPGNDKALEAAIAEIKEHFKQFTSTTNYV